MTATPETDDIALLIKSKHYWVIKSDLAERERDEARTELEMWRDGNIMHEIHRNELEKVERERDEARAQRDEWIARFRADEELIENAMLIANEEAAK